MQAIPALDRYEADMIDDSAVAKSRRREMSARQRAEEAMAARDAAARQRPAASAHEVLRVWGGFSSVWRDNAIS